jgi:hypothetical protein
MNFTAQLQDIVAKYRNSDQPWPATSKQIAAWAINNKLWQPHRGALIKQCADQLANAMREEYFVDPQGRLVRTNHVAMLKRNGETLPLWNDIRTADRAHMAIAFMQRRKQVVGDCRQLKADVDSYNQNYNSGKPIQMVFDFTLDLEELGAGKAG